MRKWFKYYPDLLTQGRKNISIDNDFGQYSQAMGNYAIDDAYVDKQTFFNKYFFNYHLGRLQYYDNFLRAHLQKSWDVISIASGRCANEMFLNEDGYRIICSDVGIIPLYDATKSLFPNFDFLKLDIINGPIHKKFDAAVVLSLIFLFGEKELRQFFRNISAGLKKNGHLILDSAGSSDNGLSFFLHDIYLRFEAELLRLSIFLATRRMPGFITKHFGYRRTDRDIIKIANDSGFKLVARKNYGFLTEFRRSVIFNKIIKENSSVEKFFGIIGRALPYIRMFDFQKID